ncbi:MAG: hypothetical protein RLZZ450_1197 [Pseudomonadota bacterium]|jgi:hypothetical protein
MKADVEAVGPDGTELNLLTTALGHSNAAVRAESASLFLQYHYLSSVILRDFGLSVSRYWNIPHPDPMPWILSRAGEGLVRAFAGDLRSPNKLGDPDPEPDRNFSKAARASAIKALSARLKTALKTLEQQVAELGG